MLLGLEAFGKLSHGRPFPAGEAADLEQQEVLQGGHTVAARHLFAEAQEAAQLVAEMRELLVVRLGHAAGDRRFPYLAHAQIYHVVI